MNGYQGLFAGPIVRRVSPEAVHVWMATATSIAARAELYQVAGHEEVFAASFAPQQLVEAQRAAARVGSTDVGEVVTVQVGANLFVTLLTIRPEGPPFPLDAVLAYDIDVDGQWLADAGMTSGAYRIVYDGLALPSFVIAKRLHRFLHGSCRKLHGGGEDALANADALIQTTLLKPAQRPAALFLTGDQVYADDVDDRVYSAVAGMAEIIGGLEQLPGIDLDVARLPPGTRGPLAKKIGLTSDHADNHVLRFGEYAGLYGLAWNPDLSFFGVNSTSVLREEHAAVIAARRALANVPTYMMFDDHEVTDDWNLNATWRRKVFGNPAGRRVVANGLAAYWAFQGWGNDPSAFDKTFRDALEAYLGDVETSQAGGTFDTTLWGFDRWIYTTPTDPVGIALDLRTMRGQRENHLGAVELIANEHYRKVKRALDAGGYRAGTPLLLISGTPVFGHDIPERIQAEIGALGKPTTADVESWTANGQGMPGLLGFLRHAAGVPLVMILAGDIHYGFHVVAEFREANRVLTIAQLTSSALRNSDKKTLALENLDIAAGPGVAHEVGWRVRPRDAIRILDEATVKLIPQVIGELALDVALRGAAAQTVWRAARKVSPKIRDRSAAFGRFDRIFRELRRLQRSDDPLSLPAKIASTLPLPAPSWETTRLFAPVVGAFASLQRVVGVTNLGDVRPQLGQKRVTSILTRRKGGLVDDRAQAVLDLRDTMTHAGASPAQQRLGARAPAEVLATHVREWLRGNHDESWGKTVIPFADTRLKALPASVLPAGRGDHLKCQLHSITFNHPTASIPALAQTLATQFGQLLPPDQAEILLHQPLPLRLGSEFRWFIRPPGYTERASQVLDALIDRSRRLALSRATVEFLEAERDQEAKNRDPFLRRFDVRIREMTGPTEDHFGFTVETLSNHPYGARRSWRLRRGPGAGVYEFTTVEFNSFAWLIDLEVELVTAATLTRSLWTHLLRNFVVAVGGQATAAADETLTNVVRGAEPLLQEDTEFLLPETVNASPLGNWIRRNFSSMGTMVDPIFGPPAR